MAGCWAHARRKFYGIHAQRATDLTDRRLTTKP
ncbi:IS66 family transposase [Castellaniella caeni]